MNNYSPWGQALVNGSIFNTVIVVCALVCTTVLGVFNVLSSVEVVPILTTSMMYGVGAHVVSQNNNNKKNSGE